MQSHDESGVDLVEMPFEPERHEDERVGWPFRTFPLVQRREDEQSPTLGDVLADAQAAIDDHQVHRPQDEVFLVLRESDHVGEFQVPGQHLFLGDDANLIDVSPHLANQGRRIGVDPLRLK